MKTYAVILADNAEEDIERIGEYIAQTDSAQRARRVVLGIRNAVYELKELPERGRYVGEILNMGTRDYREVFNGPYRIIYRVTEDAVVVHLVADGRRDMRTLLMRRLLQA